MTSGTATGGESLGGDCSGFGGDCCLSDLMSVLRLFMRPPKKEVLGFGGSIGEGVEAAAVPEVGGPCGGGDGVDECSHCSRTLSFWSIFSRIAFSSADSTGGAGGKGLLPRELLLVQGGSLRLDCAAVGSTIAFRGT